MALATLASLNWDLPRAIETQLCNDNDDTDPMDTDDWRLRERNDQHTTEHENR